MSSQHVHKLLYMIRLKLWSKIHGTNGVVRLSPCDLVVKKFWCSKAVTSIVSWPNKIFAGRFLAKTTGWLGKIELRVICLFTTYK